MTKEEFLDGLMKALASTGSQSLIAENIRFYSSYIDDELSKGRSIDEIMEELGEPRLIANSIKVAAGYDDVFVGIDNETYENTAGKTGNYEENENYSDRKKIGMIVSGSIHILFPEIFFNDFIIAFFDKA